jgi:hypothetical protein
VLDAVGGKSTRNAALDAVRPGGVVVHVGLMDWASEIDMRKLTLAEITLIGTYTYSTADLNATVAALHRGAFGDLVGRGEEPRRRARGVRRSRDGRTRPRRSCCGREGSRLSNIVFDRVSRVFKRDGRDFPTLDDVSFEVATRSSSRSSARPVAARRPACDGGRPRVSGNRASSASAQGR